MNMNAKDFADQWVTAWNAHDIEKVLAHFHDHATFSSPFAKQIVPASGGKLHGKNAIRDYWTTGIRAIPDLHFTIEDVFAGIDHLVILYKNQKGVRVSEILRFDGDLVVEGHGTYPADIVNPTGSANRTQF